MLNRRWFLVLAAGLVAAPGLASAAAYRQEFSYSKDEVYAALLAALPALKLKVTFADKALGRVQAKAGMSAFSIGETLSIGVVEISQARAALELDGTVGATAMNAFAHDRVLKHFNRLVAEISSRLPVAGAG